MADLIRNAVYQVTQSFFSGPTGEKIARNNFNVGDEIKILCVASGGATAIENLTTQEVLSADDLDGFWCFFNGGDINNGLMPISYSYNIDKVIGGYSDEMSDTSYASIELKSFNRDPDDNLSQKDISIAQYGKTIAMSRTQAKQLVSELNKFLGME